MKKLTKLLLAASILTISGAVSAIPITGSIGFGGSYTHNGTSGFSDATSITITNAFVSGVTSGDFLAAGITAGDSVSYSSFTFSPVGFVDDLWHVGDFGFDLTNMVNVHQSENFLVLSGSGTLFGANFDATPGKWGFTANNFGSSFTWSNSTTAVPEPSIMLLIGAGLLGLRLTQKNRKAV